MNVSTIIHDSLFILIKPLSNPLNFVNRAMKEMFHLTMPAACPDVIIKALDPFTAEVKGSEFSIDLSPIPMCAFRVQCLLVSQSFSDE